MRINKTENRVKMETKNLFKRESEYFTEDDEYREALEMRAIGTHRKAICKNAKEGVSCRICRA